jgi:hypothetical protein
LYYVLFFIPEDIGEYRFYHPIIDGPQKAGARIAVPVERRRVPVSEAIRRRHRACGRAR